MTVFLNDAQMGAVLHGAAGEYSWRQIEIPVGRQDLPSWAIGAHVDWWDSCANSPHYSIKVTHDAYEWGDVRWVKEGAYYRRLHDDGRMKQYAHDGAVSIEKLRRFRSFDGTVYQYPPHGALGKYVADPSGKAHDSNDYTCWPHRTGEFVEVEMRATTKQSGFGGAEIELLMDDGIITVLRGPWHTVGPEGWTEVSFNERKEPDAWDRRHKRKWWQRVGTAGHWIRNDVFLKIMARFEPHLEWAEVERPGFKKRLEPIRFERGMPKTIYQHLDWEKTREELKAKRELEGKKPL